MTTTVHRVPESCPTAFRRVYNKFDTELIILLSETWEMVTTLTIMLRNMIRWPKNVLDRTT